jgi:hypothetical protein
MIVSKWNILLPYHSIHNLTGDSLDKMKRYLVNTIK